MAEPMKPVAPVRKMRMGISLFQSMPLHALSPCFFVCRYRKTASHFCATGFTDPNIALCFMLLK
jgi:hypothetical protein